MACKNEQRFNGFDRGDGGGDGDGGFFLACEDLGGGGLTIYSPLALFFFFLSGGQLLHSDSIFLGQDQSTLV